MPSSAIFITTDFQTAGRGQAQNSWWATAGKNYLGSLIYFPQAITVTNIFALTQAMSLAVVQITMQLGQTINKDEIKIKWPNDIYVGDKKIAGLLIQNSLLGNQIQWSVMGLGLNINETSFPKELQTKASSLALLESGQEQDISLARKTVFATSLATLNQYLEPLTLSALQRDYHQRLYRLEVWADYFNLAANQHFKGKIRGVDTDGRLQIEHTIGRVQTYDLKEIRFV